MLASEIEKEESTDLLGSEIEKEASTDMLGNRNGGGGGEH